MEITHQDRLKKERTGFSHGADIEFVKAKINEFGIAFASISERHSDATERLKGKCLASQKFIDAANSCRHDNDAPNYHAERWATKMADRIVPEYDFSHRFISNTRYIGEIFEGMELGILQIRQCAEDTGKMRKWFGKLPSNSVSDLFISPEFATGNIFDDIILLLSEKAAVALSKTHISKEGLDKIASSQCAAR